jgi:PAS domain S-box-containing protein
MTGQSRSKSRIPALVTAGLAVLVACVAIASYVTWHEQAHSLQQQAVQSLAAVANLKATEISAWVAERRGDAETLHDNPLVPTAVGDWLVRGDAEPFRTEVVPLLSTMVKVFGYTDIAVLDGTGALRYSLPRETSRLTDTERRLVADAATDGAPQVSDLYIDSSGMATLASVVPMTVRSAEDQRTVGSILLRTDADQFLFPTIQKWPLPSPSGETLLVERDGDDVLFLNELRHRKGTALTLREPLTSPALPAAIALRGERGLSVGADYRGVEVVFAYSRVPGTPWRVVAKIDRAEVVGPATTRAWLAGGLTAGFASALGLGMLLWWRSRTARATEELLEARLQAEEALRESEERFRLATENVSDVIWTLDLDTMRFTYVSPSVLTLRGFTPQEVMSEDVSASLTAQSYELVQGLIPVRLVEIHQGVGKTYVDEIEQPRKDGSTVWTETTTRYTVDEKTGHDIVYGVSRDITARRLVEQALRVSEERLLAHIDNSPLAIIEFDADFRLTRWSQQAEQLFGWTADEVLGRAIEELRWVHEDDVDSVRRESTALFGGERPRSFHANRNYRKDGMVVNCEWYNSAIYDADGHLVSVLSQVLDITERMQAAKALRESREDLNRAQAVAHTGSWRLDVNRNELTWSDENHRIFGLPPGTPMSYETFLGCVHPDDREYVDREWMAGLQGAPYDIEHRIVAGDTVKWVRERAELERDEDGQLRGGFGTTEDITARRLAEAALRESEAKYRGLFEAFHETVAVYEVVRDEHGVLVDRVLREGNQALVQTAGVDSIDEIIGKTAGQIFGREHADENLPHIREAMRSGAIHVFESHRSSHGEKRHFITSVVPLDDDHYLLTGRDITAIKETEDALRQSRRRAELLAQIAGRLLSSDDPNVVVDELCRRVMEELDCQAFFNFLVDERVGRPRLNAYAGIGETEAQAAMRLDYGDAVCARVAEEGRRIVVEDVLQAPQPLTELVAAYGIRAYAAHPLMAGKRVIGTLSFGTRTRDHFADADLTLMQSVADHLASALSRARAERGLRDSEQRYRDLATELEVERGKLAAAIDRVDVGLVFAAADGTILSMNAKALQLHGFESHESMFAELARYANEFELRHPDGRQIPPDEWPLSRALHGLYVRDFEARVRRIATGQEAIVSYSGVPVYGADREIVLIVLSMYDLTERRRLEEELRTELETSSVLLEAASTLAEWTDSLETLGGVVRLVAAVSGHSRVGLHVWHPDDRELELVAATGHGVLPVGTRTSIDRLSETTRQGLLTKRSVVVDFDMLTPGERGPARNSQARLSLSVPILHRGSLAGLLVVDEPRERREFTDRQIALVEGIAAQVAVAIENAGLYEAQRRIATVLQEQFIHPLPKIEGLEIAVVAETAHQPELVGGDFHDVFELPHGPVAVLMGDVEGKGVSAAALSETVRSAVRALAIVSPSPRYILNNVNRMLLQQHSTQFVTALLTIVNPLDGLALAASAGHPAGILVSDEMVSTVTMQFGVPLGALPWDHEQTSFRLEPGDSLVVYTDGVSEARRDGQIFGEEGVVEALRAASRERPAQMARAVRDAAARFAGRLQDDMQLVVLRFCGRELAPAAAEPSCLSLVVPDAPWRLVDIRGAVRDFLCAHAVEDAAVDDLVMCVEEACTNALRHSGSAEPTEVRLSIDPAVVEISVRDYGCGFDAAGLDLTQLPDPLALGGRGLYLIRSVVDELELTKCQGTTVHLRKFRAAGRAL